jgi:hypothetical protein
MVAPFFEPGAVLYTDESLIECLFGSTSERPNSKHPSSFFSLPEAASISAVMYCNPFQVSRFFRLATNFDSDTKVAAVREGTCYHNHPESGYEPFNFRFKVGSSLAPTETWSEGVTIFENPRALRPLPKQILPCTSTILMKDNRVFREVHGFHPLVSYTKIYTPDMA